MFLEEIIQLPTGFADLQNLLQTELHTHQSSQHSVGNFNQVKNRSLEEFANKASALDAEFSKTLREFNEATGDSKLERYAKLSNVHQRITYFQSDNEPSIRSAIHSIKTLRTQQVRITTSFEQFD